jgi:hypothetical protein
MYVEQIIGMRTGMARALPDAVATAHARARGAPVDCGRYWPLFGGTGSSVA